MKKLILRTFSTAVILFALLVGLRIFYGYTSAYTLWSTVMPTPGVNIPINYGLSTTMSVQANYFTSTGTGGNIPSNCMVESFSSGASTSVAGCGITMIAIGGGGGISGGIAMSNTIPCTQTSNGSTCTVPSNGAQAHSWALITASGAPTAYAICCYQ